MQTAGNIVTSRRGRRAIRADPVETIRNRYGFVLPLLSDGAATGGVAGCIASGDGCVIGGFVDAVVAWSVPGEGAHCIHANAATRITAATAIHVPHELPRRVNGGVVRSSGSLLGS